MILSNIDCQPSHKFHSRATRLYSTYDAASMHPHPSRRLFFRMRKIMGLRAVVLETKTCQSLCGATMRKGNGKFVADRNMKKRMKKYAESFSLMVFDYD